MRVPLIDNLYLRQPLFVIIANVTPYLIIDVRENISMKKKGLDEFECTIPI